MSSVMSRGIGGGGGLSCKTATEWFRARKRVWRERERESCCEVKRLLDMWGVPTLFKNP